MGVKNIQTAGYNGARTVFGNNEIVLFDWNNQCFYHQVSLHHKPSPVGLLCDQNNNWHNELKSFLKKHCLIYVLITPP